MAADALTCAGELGHPVYDCLYLIAAVRGDGMVVTADRRFHAAGAGHPRWSSRIVLL